MLQKAKERYSKEKAAEHYAQNKEAIKEKPREPYKTYHKKKKTRLKNTKEKGIMNWFSIKRKRWKINNFLFFYVHYTCIACIIIDSVMRMEKKNYPQVYLEECKYKIKKMQISRFINTELELDLDSDSESYAELIARLKSNSDNDSDNDSE